MVAATQPYGSTKPRMLVVDDEPDNLDLLYRTFRRDFNVLRAESGQEALEILAAQGEVAVIISDQRMPEMKGTEFLSKTLPDFPDTVRIILTGFTDFEDLVDAINGGQVYRYITKPWDPDELKHVVAQAANTYTLLKQRGEAINLSKHQHQLVMEMAIIAQSHQDVPTALPKIADAIRTAVGCHGCAVQLVAQDILDNQNGTVGTAGIVSHDVIRQDPMVQEAIATKTLKSCPDTIQNFPSATPALYGAANIKTHSIAPVLFRGEVIAMISLQWSEPKASSELRDNLVKMAAQQVALLLSYL